MQKCTDAFDFESEPQAHFCVFVRIAPFTAFSEMRGRLYPQPNILTIVNRTMRCEPGSQSKQAHKIKPSINTTTATKGHRIQQSAIPEQMKGRVSIGADKKGKTIANSTPVIARCFPLLSI